ncbi:MAG TPA: hypothetical protein VFH43_11975, partial [Candidatus Kapabacteria bacterium]|nr:hypothetical protein [Candidatus Kapabacteria bacterium]
MFKKNSILALALGVASFTVASCGSVESPVDAGDASFGAKKTTTTAKGGGKKGNTTAPIVSGTGYVRVMTDANGLNYYGIELADGTRYEVLNFPSGAFVDGQLVNFSGWVQTDYTMGHNYGTALI